jgi:hypothetical protein
MNPEDFLSIIQGSDKNTPIDFRFGSIPADYASGRPKIQFDGESTVSTNTYPYLSSYAPAAGEKVLLVRVRNSWVILGKVL